MSNRSAIARTTRPDSARGAVARPRIRPFSAVTPFAGILAGLALACSGGDAAAPTPPPSPVATVAFPTPVDSVVIGQTRQLSVTTLDAGSRILAGRAITWSVTDSTVARVSPSGLVTGLSLGDTYITARSEGISGSLTFSVVKVPVATIAFTTTLPTVNVGDTLRLAAVPSDAAGNPLTDRLVTFSSTAPGVLGVTPAGVAVGLAAGSASVIATSGGRTAELAVTVRSLPVAQIRIVPGVLEVAPGITGPLTVTATDIHGNPTASLLTFSSSDPAVATFKAPGRFTAVAPGSATISVSADGVTSSVPVSVQAITPGTFHFDLRFVGKPDADIQAAAQRAAARWERVLPAALASQTVSLAAGACETLAPAISGTTTSIIVTVAKDSIDGPSKILAEAGPCVMRADGIFPAIGAVDIDSADVALMVARGTLENVITHELGHVLGIGTVWSEPARHLLSGTTGSDPRYVAPAGVRAAIDLGFLGSDSAKGVEVENVGGAGSILGHWRETVYSTELMTSVDGPGNTAPLSRITSGALRDLGYTTRDAGADFFSAATAKTGGRTISNGVSPSLNVLLGLGHGEVLLFPRFVALPSGKVIPIAKPVTAGGTVRQ